MSLAAFALVNEEDEEAEEVGGRRGLPVLRSSKASRALWARKWKRRGSS